METMAGAPTAVDAADGERSVFIEMDEYIPAEHRWVETHRWNYGMEEDLVGGHWMAAHLPTVSARALATLIASTSDTSSIVLTAEEVGEANRPKKRHQTLRGLVRTVLSGLLNAQRITEDECEAALRALLAHPKSLRPPREVDADAAAADVDVLEELDMLAPDATAEEALEIMVAPVLKAGPRNTGNIDDRAGAYVTSTAAAARGGAGVARAPRMGREFERPTPRQFGGERLTPKPLHPPSVPCPTTPGGARWRIMHILFGGGRTSHAGPAPSV